MRRLIDLVLDLLGFARFVLRRWSEDRCPQMAGNLTYTTLLAIVPSFAVGVALLSSTPLFASAMAQARDFLLANLAPAAAERVIGTYLDDFARNARRLTWPGLAAVLVLAVATMLIIDRSLNAIWRVRRRRPYWVLVPGYVAVLVAGPVLVGIGMAVTTYVLSAPVGLASVVGASQAALVEAAPVVLTAVAFFLVYKIVPHRRVPWRHALVGAGVAAVLFEAAKELFAVYVRHATTYSLVYGAFAAVPIFLVWLELSWMVVLLGAEITACAGYWHAHLWTRADRPGTRFHEAVRVAGRLAAAYPAALGFERLRRDAVLPAPELDDLLARLSEAGIVERAGRGQFVLAEDPEHATVGELYEAAVAPVGGMRPEEWAEISKDFARAAAEMREGLERPLATLSSKLEATPAPESPPSDALSR
ncbi:MAG TPA: YihY family inner membrane protein [Usitatibacter sp.]|nr:YihY family inner membrane protein [Usitatibacter sp.]